MRPSPPRTWSPARVDRETAFDLDFFSLPAFPAPLREDCARGGNKVLAVSSSSIGLQGPALMAAARPTRQPVNPGTLFGIWC